MLARYFGGMHQLIAAFTITAKFRLPAPRWCLVWSEMLYWSVNRVDMAHRCVNRLCLNPHNGLLLACLGIRKLINRIMSGRQANAILWFCRAGLSEPIVNLDAGRLVQFQAKNFAGIWLSFSLQFVQLRRSIEFKNQCRSNFTKYLASARRLPTDARSTRIIWSHGVAKTDQYPWDIYHISSLDWLKSSNKKYL